MTLGIGIIGCGNISTAYLSRAPLFHGIEMRAVADIEPEAANVRAREHDVRATSVDELLAATDIDVIVNLTIPGAHFAVSRAALQAGKHVYSEKPLALNFEEGQALARLAEETGLRVGCAPDTFLGASHQVAREVVDAGGIGTVTHSTCHVMSPGMEMWHPNPDFFFKLGGGPVLDVGPYYVAALINLIGPVKRVAAVSSTPKLVRTITSERRYGQTIDVETPTTVHALMEFESGASVTLSASWDVHAHRHGNLEIYGSEGTLFCQDPNFFGGTVEVIDEAENSRILDGADHPLSVANRTTRDGKPRADYRSVGLADMADAIEAGRDHRCSLERALHTLDVLTAILRSGETGRFETLSTSCTRPEPFDAETARALMKEAVAA